MPVKLFDVPLEGPILEPFWRGALGADGRAPDLVEAANAPGGGRMGPALAGFERVELGASTLECDAVERGKGADGANASFGFIGYARD